MRADVLPCSVVGDTLCFPAFWYCEVAALDRGELHGRGAGGENDCVKIVEVLPIDAAKRRFNGHRVTAGDVCA